MKFKRYRFISLVLVGLIFFFVLHLFFNYQAPILFYHNLGTQNSLGYHTVSFKTFQKQMEFIKARKYNVISLKEYCILLANKKPIPRNTVVITFDDGFKSNIVAAKILKKLNLPATFFIIANTIGKTGYLTEKDIKRIIKYTPVEIGSHTLNHFYLPSLDKKQIRNEIFESKRLLGKLFSVSIDTISYPIGGFNNDVLEITKEAGYLCACTTNRGFSKKLNRFALRRIKITNRDLGFRLWIKLSGYYNYFKGLKKPY